MNQEGHLQKLLYLEMESHTKGQIQRENRLLQLRLISFAVVSALVGFTDLTKYETPTVYYLLVGIIIIGLFTFDLFYCKISRQEGMRNNYLAKQDITKLPKVEFFPLKTDKNNKIKWYEWYKALGFDHLWYLFILILSLVILYLNISHIHCTLTRVP